MLPTNASSPLYIGLDGCQFAITLEAMTFQVNMSNMGHIQLRGIGHVNINRGSHSMPWFLLRRISNFLVLHGFKLRHEQHARNIKGCRSGFNFKRNLNVDLRLPSLTLLLWVFQRTARTLKFLVHLRASVTKAQC